LECELFDQQAAGRFTSHHEAKLAVFDYLEAFFNPCRRHSAIGQISPAAFEKRYANSLRHDHVRSNQAVRESGSTPTQHEVPAPGNRGRAPRLPEDGGGLGSGALT
jgi:hypothetical protein